MQIKTLRRLVRALARQGATPALEEARRQLRQRRRKAREALHQGRLTSGAWSLHRTWNPVVQATRHGAVGGCWHRLHRLFHRTG